MDKKNYNIQQSKHKMFEIDEALDAIMKISQIVLLKNNINKENSNLLNTEKISTIKSLGRKVSNDLKSPINIPSKPTSMMDGYAINVNDYDKKKTNCFKINKKIYADGRIEQSSLNNNDFRSSNDYPNCVYITTGSPIPEYYNCVVPVERLYKIDNNTIELLDNAVIKENSFIRNIGDNIKKDSVIIERDTIMNEVNIALLASVGITQIEVYKKIKIGIFSNGDEVINPFENEYNDNIEDNINQNSLIDGKLFDTNKTILCLLLKKHFKESIEIIDLKINNDSITQVKDSIMKASDLNCSVIISTGGVSMGEHDYVKMFFEEGDNNILYDYDSICKMIKTNSMSYSDKQIFVGRINMKPGLPTMFAIYKNSLFFGLSGNPVSCVVGYEMFTRHTINFIINNMSQYNNLNRVEMSNSNANDKFIYNNIIKAECLHNFNVNSDRPELVRGKIYLYNSKFYCENTIQNQLSSTFFSFKDSNCFIHLPSSVWFNNKYGKNILNKKDTVDVFLTDQLFLISNEKEFNEISIRIEKEKRGDKTNSYKGCCNHQLNESNNRKKNENENSNYKIKIGLLVISDKLINKEYESNLALIKLKEEIIKYNLNQSKLSNNSELELINDYEEKLFSIIPNNKEIIETRIKEIIESKKIDVLFTSGGTGVSNRDFTSQIVEMIIEKKCRGLENLITNKSLEVNLFASLSNTVCGISNDCLVITLPGNPKAVVEIFGFVKGVLYHFVNQMHGVKDFH